MCLGHGGAADRAGIDDDHNASTVSKMDSSEMASSSSVVTLETMVLP